MKENKIRNIIILTSVVMLIAVIYYGGIKINKQSKDVVNINANNITEIKLFNYKNKKEETTYEITETTTENIIESITTEYILLPKDTAPIISKMGYKVNTKNLKDIDEKKEKNVVINYPQLTGFKNKNIQNKVNKTIKDAALLHYNFSKKKDSDFYNNIEWIVDYTIEYIDKNMISIVFRGYKCGMENKEIFSYAFGINTVNVNLHTGNKITINELFEDSYKKIINKRDLDFCTYNGYYHTASVNKYKYDPKYKPYNKERDRVAEYSDSYKNNDGFFIKENGFVFIMPISSNGEGTYLANYDDLMDSIKWENEVWAGIFKKERG